MAASGATFKTRFRTVSIKEVSALAFIYLSARNLFSSGRSETEAQRTELERSPMTGEPTSGYPDEVSAVVADAVVIVGVAIIELHVAPSGQRPIRPF